ncbi:hypothetical protein C8R47DRAFT_405727 [Mycena vitilis]|nr:hypothetical protein C8R47DRAFT_405727 [Mycena vitilis]
MAAARRASVESQHHRWMPAHRRMAAARRASVESQHHRWMPAHRRMAAARRASVESQHIIVGCPPIGGGYASVTHLVTHRSSPSTSSLDAHPSVEVTHRLRIWLRIGRVPAHHRWMPTHRWRLRIGFSTAHGKRVGPTPKPSTVSPKSATQAQSVLSHLFPAALAKGSSLTRLCAEQARTQSRRTSPAHSTLLSLLFPRCAVSRKHLLLSRFPICFGDSGTMSKFCNFYKQHLDSGGRLARHRFTQRSTPLSIHEPQLYTGQYIPESQYISNFAFTHADLLQN